MSGPYLVGVDCGTQSAKVAVYDASGAEIASGREPLRPMHRPEPGVAVHPDDDLWTAVAAASTAAMSDFDGDPDEIVGIGLCPIRCCKAFLHADGSLAEPVISWMDARAYEPYVPDDPTVAWATTSSGYLAHRFTSRFRDTAANNVGSQWPIDPHTRQWSDDPSVLARYGVQRKQLVELLQPGDVIGPLTADAAAATGLTEGVPVVATANDKAVEMLGAGPLGDSTALISLGTYITAMMHGDEYHEDPQHFWSNFASIPGTYLHESNGIRRGMWTLTWFLDLLGPEFADHVRSLGVGREQYLEREALEVPAGSDGLMIALDWLASADAPHRKGSMLGFDARHGRGHIYRAIMEAIAVTMNDHVTAMCDELGVPLDEIVVSGGGANSALFMKIFADVFDVPTSRSTGPSGASLGAAICAAAATGVHPDIPTAVAAMTRSRQRFVSDPSNSALYATLADTIHPHIRESTDSLYARTHPIFH